MAVKEKGRMTWLKPRELEAIRKLADFANTYAEDVFGDNETEYEGSTANIEDITKAADIALKVVPRL